MIWKPGMLKFLATCTPLRKSCLNILDQLDEENNLGEEDRRRRVFLISQLKDINCKLDWMLKQKAMVNCLKLGDSNTRFIIQLFCWEGRWIKIKEWRRQVNGMRNQKSREKNPGVSLSLVFLSQNISIVVLVACKYLKQHQNMYS